jgi:hypothetical protein
MNRVSILCDVLLEANLIVHQFLLPANFNNFNIPRHQFEPNQAVYRDCTDNKVGG